MTVRRKKSFGTNWYFKNPAYSLYPTYGWMRTRRRAFRATVPIPTSSEDSREMNQPHGTYGSKKTVSDEFDVPNRVSRLTVLFAVLFVVLLVVTISCICAFAIFTNGFSNLSGERRCPEKEGHEKPTYRKIVVPEEVCLTDSCIRIAAHYLNNMNKQADPCTDFYEFACGQYSSSRVVPEHEKKIAVLAEMKAELDRRLKSILEQSAKNESDAMRLSQIYYLSCMDEESQEAMDLMPVTQLISSVGGWALLQNAKFDATHFRWESLAGKLAQLGVGTLVRLFVHTSLVDSSRNMLMFSPPKLLLEKKKFYKEPLEKNPHLQHYKIYMMDLLELFGAERDAIEGSVDDVIRFECSIASIMQADSTRNHTSMRNEMTLATLRRRFPKIDLNLFLNEELLQYLSPLTEDTVVNVVDVEYFSRIEELVGRTPLQTVSDYMMWKLVCSFDAYLPPRYRVPFDNFRMKLVGSAMRSTWQQCVTETRNNLAMPLASGYAHRFFNWDHRHHATELIGDLKAAMESTLLNADWMDEETRHGALTKLAAMSYKVGFPDSLLNTSAVLAPFAGVRLAANTFFENSLVLRKVAVREKLLKLHRGTNRDEWATPVVAVDAYHYFNGNEIIFPAGILQYPMFVPDAPSFVNYGSIGMGIGHEITHGYDDLGAQYDSRGNLRRWWQPETLRVFNSKKQCFIAQYGSKFEPISERKLDGRLTVGENIADNGGLRVAYSAYHIRTTRRPDTQALPGLTNFTDEQLFFIAFANTWCEAVKPQAIDYILDTSTHALGMFRVNVPLQNFPAFSQAFRCPIGSGMNPFEKCRIW